MFLLCACLLGQSHTLAETVVGELSETWVQDHRENEKNYETFIFSLRGDTIVGGHGQSLNAGGAMNTMIEGCNANGDITCKLSRSDGKTGSLHIISRDATTMRATVAYLAPGQTQTWMPPITIFKKKK